MPAAGTARIVIARAAPARKAAASTVKFRRVGVVKVKLKKGRNVVRVKRVKKRKLTARSYRATITPKVGKRDAEADPAEVPDPALAPPARQQAAWLGA